MVIMAMATARKIRNFKTATVLALLSWFAISSTVFAGEWKFVPNLGIEETYTDNVELTITDPTSSLVSQAKIGIEAEYESRLAYFALSAENNNLFFSHDSGINDSYLSLNTQGEVFLWTSGPSFFANANISNTNRNAANNGLADLVSGDTVQSENYSTGLRYNVTNSTFSLQSMLTYNINRFEDGIGEYNGVSANLNIRNSNNARVAFWQLSSSFSTKSQDFSGETRKGEQYNVEALLGLITTLKVTPFARFYDEGLSGAFTNQKQNTTSSWGPGIRWLISPRLSLDVSYNYVADDSVSDDYLAASIQWEPSARTSLLAGYNKRFFGDSYNLDLKHKTKRLTNTISYNETLEVFDRNNFEQIDLGVFWCPPDVDLANISQCSTQSQQPISSEFNLVNFFYFEPIESNEFSLNKRLSWASKLQLARTSFAFNSTAFRREGIESKVVDDNLSASFTVERKVSGKSKLTFLAKYDYLIFDKNNPEGSRQEDRYRTVSATYTKDLASSLSTNFTLQHVNRDSSVEQYTYDEARAIINVTKEF